MRRAVLPLCAVLLVAWVREGRAVSSDVVISQVYGGGGNPGAVFASDFVELFNRSNARVSLVGWTLQYAASGTATWQTVALTGSIGGGRYYLVKLADGAGTALPLPPADATGSINLSATTGKVAVVAAVAPLAGACPASGAIDLVGYGSADCSEGSAAPAAANSVALVRAAAGCTDTDSNAADFSVGLPNPRNSATPAHPCGATTGSNPTGLAFASPSVVPAGSATLLTVAVIPGTDPPSSGLAVRGDLGLIGGSVAQAFFNDGTNGDATAGDGVWSFRATVPAGTAAGQKLLPITITDAQTRTGSVSLSVTVTSGALTGGASVVFPHVADGGGYRTTLLLTNPSDVATSATVSFFASDGTALRVGVGGATASSFTIAMPARGAVRLQTSGAGTGVSTGWARVTTSPAAAVAGNAVFQLFDGTTLLTEASVPAAPPTASTEFFVDEDDRFNTGVALANSGLSAAAGTITLRDRAGALQGSYPFTLAAGNHTARFVFQLFPGAQSGRAEIATTSGSVSATALRVHASGIFSTVSVGAVPTLSALFSPRGGIRSRLISEIQAAASRIDVAAYTFTSPELRDALIAARGRGITVRLIVDASQASAQGSVVETLEGLGFSVKRLAGAGAGIMHDSFVVIDGSTVVTGSYNWTAAAEDLNFENALVVQSGTVAQGYAAEFESRFRR